MNTKSAEHNVTIDPDVNDELASLCIQQHMWHEIDACIHSGKTCFILEDRAFQMYDSIRYRVVRLSRRTLILYAHLWDSDAYPVEGCYEPLTCGIAIPTHVITSPRSITLNRVLASRVRDQKVLSMIRLYRSQPSWLKDQLRCGLKDKLKCFVWQDHS